MRHLVWELTLLALLALPAALPLLPRWELRVLPGRAAAAGVAVGGRSPGARGGLGIAVENAGLAPSAAGSREAAEANASGVGIPAAPRSSFSLASFLFLLWLAGFLVTLARFVSARIRVGALARQARSPEDPAWASLLGELAERMGVDRRVELLLGPRASLPMTWGIFAPRILIPEDANRWPGARLRSVLLHELEHVRRRDSLVQALMWLTMAVYWFHPGVWMAVRRLRLAREVACDDSVLRQGVPAREYGRQLVEFARRLKGLTPAAGTRLAPGHPSDLGRRLVALVDAGRRRHRLTRLSAGVGVCVALAALATIGGAELTRRPPAAPKLGESTAESPPGRRLTDALLPTVSVAPPAAAEASGAPVRTAPDPAAAVARRSARQAGRASSPRRPGGSGPTRQARRTAGPTRGTRTLASAVDGSPARVVETVHGRAPLPSPEPAASVSGAGEASTSGPVVAREDEGRLADRVANLDPTGVQALVDSLVRHGTTRSLAEVMDIAYLAPDAQERVRAVRALGRDPAKGGRFIFQIVRAHPEAAVRRAGIETLAHLHTGRVIPWLVDVAYRDKDVSVQREAVRLLAGMDPAATDAGLLQLARSHPSSAVRLEALYWLVRRGSGEALAAYVAAA